MSTYLRFYVPTPSETHKWKWTCIKEVSHSSAHPLYRIFENKVEYGKIYHLTQEDKQEALNRFEIEIQNYYNRLEKEYWKLVYAGGRSDKPVIDVFDDVSLIGDTLTEIQEIIKDYQEAFTFIQTIFHLNTLIGIETPEFLTDCELVK